LIGPLPAVGLGHGSLPCSCDPPTHEPRLVAVTGGPGGGKTAALEMARRMLCRHVAILPEAASVLFGGGFPRHTSAPARRAAQRAIFHVQRQLERMVVEEGGAAVLLCDRGTLDGLAYWPDDDASFWCDVGSSLEVELARYRAVVHLETPDAHHGYDQRNHLRIETPAEARAIDRRIDSIWSAHPRRIVVPSAEDFFQKVRAALDAIGAELPECCRATSRRE
jgi:predicted ATPase